MTTKNFKNLTFREITDTIQDVAYYTAFRIITDTFGPVVKKTAIGGTYTITSDVCDNCIIEDRENLDETDYYKGFLLGVKAGDAAVKAMSDPEDDEAFETLKKAVSAIIEYPGGCLAMYAEAIVETVAEFRESALKEASEAVALYTAAICLMQLAHEYGVVKDYAFDAIVGTEAAFMRDAKRYGARLDAIGFQGHERAAAKADKIVKAVALLKTRPHDDGAMFSAMQAIAALHLPAWCRDYGKAFDYYLTV